MEIFSAVHVTRVLYFYITHHILPTYYRLLYFVFLDYFFDHNDLLCEPDYLSTRASVMHIHA